MPRFSQQNRIAPELRVKAVQSAVTSIFSGDVAANTRPERFWRLLDQLRKLEQLEVARQALVDLPYRDQYEILQWPDSQPEGDGPVVRKTLQNAFLQEYGLVVLGRLEHLVKHAATTFPEVQWVVEEMNGLWTAMMSHPHLVTNLLGWCIQNDMVLQGLQVRQMDWRTLWDLGTGLYAIRCSLEQRDNEQRILAPEQEMAMRAQRTRELLSLRPLLDDIWQELQSALADPTLAISLDATEAEPTTSSTLAEERTLAFSQWCQSFAQICSGPIPTAEMEQEEQLAFQRLELTLTPSPSRPSAEHGAALDPAASLRRLVEYRQRRLEKTSSFCPWEHQLTAAELGDRALRRTELMVRARGHNGDRQAVHLLAPPKKIINPQAIATSLSAVVTAEELAELQVWLLQDLVTLNDPKNPLVTSAIISCMPLLRIRSGDSAEQPRMLVNDLQLGPSVFALRALVQKILCKQFGRTEAQWLSRLPPSACSADLAVQWFVIWLGLTSTAYREQYPHHLLFPIGRCLGNPGIAQAVDATIVRSFKQKWPELIVEPDPASEEPGDVCLDKV